ncbi:LysR family transcriptional regulator [Lacticaseibacillus sp. GG6-2]
MSIQQMRYILAVADNGSFHAAAKKLYVSQPSLSHSIKELERDLGTTLFTRTRQGAALTAAGALFVQRARKILDQIDDLNHYFTPKPFGTEYFSIAGQHYDFMSDAVCQVLKQFPNCQYLRVFEGTTSQVIEDLKLAKSEVGFIFTNVNNEALIASMLAEGALTATDLGTFSTHIFMRTNHPLAAKTILTKADLIPYPQIRFTQDTAYSELAEDPLVAPSTGQVIATADRATMIRVLAQTDAYSSGTGIITDPEQQGLTTRRLDGEPENHMLLLQHNDHELSELAAHVITAVQSHLTR